MTFDASGTARLTNWTARITSQGAAPKLDTVEEDGRQLLHIDVRNRGGTGSWRTRVCLPGGQYRFEGRARIRGAPAGAGISLRVSGQRVRPRVPAGTDWAPVSCPLRIEGIQAEVELVCEFTGSRGEAWFDADSLRLVRE